MSGKMSAMNQNAPECREECREKCKAKNTNSKCSTRNKISQTNNKKTFQNKQQKVTKVELGDGREHHRSDNPGWSASGIEK